MTQNPDMMYALNKVLARLFQEHEAGKNIDYQAARLIVNDVKEHVASLD